ncbi:MAG: branched-chain amino acid ABC transporter permease, partial [Synergistes sp.]|nr:branched-chain amino acid ABC transporter permease [Synergistes sp.]
LIALPCLRLGGDYLGIATLGFGEIIRVIFTNMTPVTNGALGLKGIPAYAGLGWNYFWCILTIYVIVRLLSGNFGNTLRAVRDDEVAAKAMGINTFRTKTISFVVGAFFAGVGGSLMGSLITTIDPKMFNFQLTFNILMFVVVGGLGSVTGSVVGAVVITVLLEWLRFVEETIKIGSWEIAGMPGMRMLIFSLLLLFIILYRREGIIGGYEFSWESAARFARRITGRKARANG